MRSYSGQTVQEHKTRQERKKWVKLFKNAKL
jgi:hypothetical protein